MIAENVYIAIEPKTFEQMFPSSKAVGALSHQLRTGHLPHSLLLVGPSGSGKNTLAYALARGLNCTAELKPCGECDACKSMDEYVTKVNAGDERGIEIMRDIVKQASYRPVMYDKGILLIDEAGGLTTDAQRALRELLENPPSHRYIIMCTSEPGKISNDIKQRCQVVDLGSMPFDVAVDFAKYAIQRINLMTDVQGKIDDPVIRDIVDISNCTQRQIIIQCYNYMSTGILLETSAETPVDILQLYSALLDGRRWTEIQGMLKGMNTKFQDAKTYICNLAQRSIVVSKDYKQALCAANILEAMLPMLVPDNQKADFISRTFSAWKLNNGGPVNAAK